MKQATKQLIKIHLDPRIRRKIKRWEKKNKPRIYFAAHIEGYGKKRDSKFRDNNLDLAILLERKGFEVFLPQRDNPFGVLHSNSQGWEMALVDQRMIELANLVFAIGGFGKDTSWEIGLAHGMGKPVVLYLPNAEVAEYHKKDWMLLRGISTIIGPLEACEIMRSSVAVPPFLRILELEDLSKIDFALTVLSSPDGLFSRAVGVL